MITRSTKVRLTTLLLTLLLAAGVVTFKADKKYIAIDPPNERMMAIDPPNEIQC